MEATGQIEPFRKKIRNHPLVTTFLKENETCLFDSNPRIETMKRVFYWIQTEGEIVTGTPKKRLDSIALLTELRFWTARHFRKFLHLSVETERESKKVGKHLRKFEDDINRGLNRSPSHTHFKFFGPGFGAEADHDKYRFESK